MVLLDSERKVADEVDTPDFGDTKGESYARTVNGGGEWRIAAVPAKGFSNTGGADASLKGVLVINEVYTYADGSERTTSISSNSTMRAAATSTSVA